LQESLIESEQQTRLIQWHEIQFIDISCSVGTSSGICIGRKGKQKISKDMP